MMDWGFEKRNACPGCGKLEGPFAYYARCVEHRVEPKVFYNFYACLDCGMIFQNSIMDKETRDKFYADEYRILTSGAKGSLDDDIALEKRRSERVISFFIDYLKSEGHEPDAVIGSWLDVGCATGELLEAIRQRFAAADVKGVEPNDETRLIAWNRGLPVVPSLDALKCNQIVVSACHVLEHVPDPYEFLVSLKKHIAPDGFLIVDVPHACGIQIRALTFTHLQAFGKEALLRIMKRAGYRVLQGGEWPDPQVKGMLSDITLIATPEIEYDESDALIAQQEAENVR